VLRAIEHARAAGDDPTHTAKAAAARAATNVERKREAREWDERDGKLTDLSAFERAILPLTQGVPLSRLQRYRWALTELDLAIFNLHLTNSSEDLDRLEQLLDRMASDGSDRRAKKALRLKRTAHPQVSRRRESIAATRARPVPETITSGPTQVSTQNLLVGGVCAVGAFIAAVLSPIIGGSACGGEESFAAALPLVAAALTGVATALLMPRTGWRFVLVPLASLLVLVLDFALFASSAIDTHYCGS
jgi:hypothetical protein